MLTVSVPLNILHLNIRVIWTIIQCSNCARIQLGPIEIEILGALLSFDFHSIHLNYRYQAALNPPELRISKPHQKRDLVLVQQIMAGAAAAAVVAGAARSTLKQTNGEKKTCWRSQFTLPGTCQDTDLYICISTIQLIQQIPF